MKKIVVLLGVLMAGLFSFLGCPNSLLLRSEADNGGSSTEGAVVLKITDNRAKTIDPGISLEVDHYSITFMRTGFLDVVMDPVFPKDLPTAPIYLRVGPWNITVTAINDEGEILGMGTKSVTVHPGAPVTVSVSIYSLSGNGTLSLTANLSALNLADPSVSGTLTPGVGGNAIDLEWDVAIDNTTASYSDSIAAGTYLLDLTLRDGLVDVASYVDTVLVMQDIPTSAGLVFRPGQGSVIVELVDEITRPIAITLSGAMATLVLGSTMTVTAVTPPGMDNYWWYLNGEIIAEATGSSVTVGEDLVEGEYQLSVVVKEGSVYSSESVVFQIIPASAQMYSLTVSMEGSGSVSILPDLLLYPEGTVVTLSAVAGSGYIFDHWSGDASGAENPLIITIAGNTSLTAYFTPESAPMYLLTVNTESVGLGSGSVEVDPAGPLYESGTIVTLTAVPGLYSFFDYWSGDASGNENPLIIDMTSDKTLTAHFGYLNQAPVINAGNTVTFNEGDPEVLIEPFLTISDIDGTTLSEASIRADGALQGEFLYYGWLDGLEIYYNRDGLLWITGVASIDTYQSVLRQISYFYVGEFNSPSTRRIIWLVSDGLNWSDEVYSYISLVPLP